MYTSFLLIYDNIYLYIHRVSLPSRQSCERYSGSRGKPGRSIGPGCAGSQTIYALSTGEAYMKDPGDPARTLSTNVHGPRFLSAVLLIEKKKITVFHSPQRQKKKKKRDSGGKRRIWRMRKISYRACNESNVYHEGSTVDQGNTQKPADINEAIGINKPIIQSSGVYRARKREI